MKDRFKFRAWYEPGKKMVDVIVFDFSDKEIIIKPLGEPFREVDTRCVTEDDAHPLQFTGYTDRDDVEIYEEDILESDLGERVVVKWDAALARFVVVRKLPGETLELRNFSQWVNTYNKVVGNMFESPELME